MASIMVVKGSCLALMICIALGAPLLAMATLTCCQLKPAMDACDCYVRKGGDKVPEDCCYEVLRLKNDVINTTMDGRVACHCIQDAARQIPDLNTTALSYIPDGCGIRLPYRFSHDMNCDNVF